MCRWARNGVLAPTHQRPLTPDQAPGALAAYLHGIVEPRLFTVDLGTEALVKKSRLFAVELVPLGGGFLALSVSVSHVLADGTTYYALCKQLDCAMKGEPIVPLVWDSPLGEDFDIAPQKATASERSTMNCGLFGALGLMLWVMRGKRGRGSGGEGGEGGREGGRREEEGEELATHSDTSFGPERIPHLEVLTRGSIEVCKKRKKADDVDYLSTNDVVTAAICGAITSSDVAFMAMDCRGVSVVGPSSLVLFCSRRLLLPLSLSSPPLSSPPLSSPPPHNSPLLFHCNRGSRAARKTWPGTLSPWSCSRGRRAQTTRAGCARRCRQSGILRRALWAALPFAGVASASSPTGLACSISW